jgi:hypothetical protein
MMEAGSASETLFYNEGQDNKTKSSVFWDITRCIPFKASQRFEGKYLLHLQDRA